MIRIEVPDIDIRHYLLAYLKTPLGQALLRRGKSGSVIDHITTSDVAALPLPLPADDVITAVAARMRAAVTAVAGARTTLLALLAESESSLPMPSRPTSPRDGWMTPSTRVVDRLDAAFYDPRVQAARSQLRSAGGVTLGELAAAELPVRYKRYYVEPGHGRPILSGRQILQFEPVNLQHVSDRSFRDAERYVVGAGTTIMAADGRAEGSQGSAAMVTGDRDGWLASNHVMRLLPRSGVRPGAVWLAMAARQTRAQVNALSFGSVVDQVNPRDVETVVVPVVPVVSDAAARQAEAAWTAFSEAAIAIRDTVQWLQAALRPDH